MIVLDTHIWIWYLDSPELLSERARTTVDHARDESDILISSISTWEVFML